MLPQLSIQQHVTCVWVRVMLSCVKAKIRRFRCLVLMTHSPTLAKLTVIQQQEYSSFPACLRLISQALQEDASIAQVSIPPSSPSSFSCINTWFVQSLEFVKKSLPSNFLNLDKVCNIEISSGKLFIFAARHESSWKKLCSCVFFKVSIDHKFENLESGKRSHCFGKKSLRKVLNFRSKNLYEPCSVNSIHRTLSTHTKGRPK